jgi:hypothetical protein
MADKKKQVMTYDSVLVFEFLLKKLARCLAKTEQTPSKLIYFVNRHNAKSKNLLVII